MTELQYRTKGGADPRGKPRVYFTCHPADLDPNLDGICGDIFAAADCAVYYTADMADRLPPETRETDLERMNLFVIPVSFRLLTEPNRARDEDLPFAREKHIPVLPILLEPGLESLYSRPDSFGELQYLYREESDPTAIPYGEKLKKYLTGVLVDGKTAERVRLAFDAWIFLSYRKKDRRLANDLMRLIHADPKCRDIAVWFDEFLTPGESFRAAIREAMGKSRVFALLVTPSLLERNAAGEPNFVQSTEYPAARFAGMELLPAEEVPTDRAALGREFPGLPEPMRMGEAGDRDRFLDRLRALASDRSADPAHTYLIGLAYLEGICVETDRDRGLALITAAAEAGLPEAMNRLAWMYDRGSGVPQDYTQAAFWAEKLAACLRENLGEENDLTLTAMQNQATALKKLGQHRQVLELEHQIYTLRCSVSGETDRATLQALDSLAQTYGELGQLQTARDLQELVYALREENLGPEDRDTLRTMNNLAQTDMRLGNYARAWELQKRAYDIQLRILGTEDPETLTSLNNLAVICWEKGDWTKALALQEEVCARREKALGENALDTLIARGNLAMQYGELGRHREALALQEKVCAKCCEVLGENHPYTLIFLGNLAKTYGKLGERDRQVRLEERVLEGLRRTLGETHPNAMTALSNLAGTYGDMGELEKALALEKKAYALACSLGRAEHPDTLYILADMAANLWKLGEQHDALALQRTVCALREKALGEGDERTIDSLMVLCGYCLALGDLQSCRETQEKICGIRIRTRGEDHPQTLSDLANLVVTCWRMGDLAYALGLLEKVWMQQTKVLGADAPETLESMKDLVTMYSALGETEKAELMMTLLLKLRQNRDGG